MEKSIFLAKNNNLFKLGVMELVTEDEFPVYAEAITDITVISISIEENRQLLLSDNKFLKILLYRMSQIISTIMNNNAESSSLKERVINHMKYSCNENILKGVEKTAFQLHCSPRQLQRVLNDLEKEEIARKCGEGTYKLI